MRPLQKEIIAYEHVLPEIDPKKKLDDPLTFSRII